MKAGQELLAAYAAHGEFAVDQLDRWARERPQARCFYYGEEDRLLTYAEFGACTDAVAGFLAGHGLRPGAPLGVFTRNPLIAALAMFGAWKAGLVYAPVNFGFSGRLLTHQLNDTAAPMLLVDADGLHEVLQVWSDLAVKPVLLLCPQRDRQPEPVPPGVEQVDWALACTGHARPELKLEPHAPCQIVYTSGTTGPAKGVLLPHRWIGQYTFQSRLMLTPEDVVYNDLPLYHVGGASYGVARAIWVGCEVACWDRFSPTQFWDRIRKVGASSVGLLDTMIPWLMNAPAREDDRANTLNKVHMQPLPTNHHAVAARFGFDVVTCGFGQTESGGSITAVIEELEPGQGTPAALHKGLDRAARTEILARHGMAQLPPHEADTKGFMGRPSPLFEAAVVDANDEFCPAGEPGQLVLRPQLNNAIFLEYIGKPEATARALRNAWFHTGDAVVLRPDGNFVFVDRMGDRMRVRGENLSSFQVEDLFCQHAAVAMACAFAVPAQEGDEDDIVVYLVLKEGAQETEHGFLAWARTAMPKFMRPRHVRLRGELPRTLTNKVEKYKLRTEFLQERAA